MAFFCKANSQYLNPTVRLSLDASVFKNIDSFRAGNSFAKIGEGTEVEVLDVQPSFVLIKCDTIIGLIGIGRVDESSYDERLEPFKVDFPKEITVEIDVLILDRPSKIGNRIDIVKKGSKIILLGKENDFYISQYKTYQGYIHESVYSRERKNPIAEIFNNENRKSHLISSFTSGNYRTETYEVNGSYYTITYRNGQIINSSTYSTFFK
jgi:hypothetical protein